MQGNMVGSSVAKKIMGCAAGGEVEILPCISFPASGHAHRPVNNLSETSDSPTCKRLTNRKVSPIKTSTAIASVHLTSFVSSIGKGRIKKSSNELLL